MIWTEKMIKNIMADMAEENPFACKALMSITEVKFTLKVYTLAVSLSDKPVLYINNIFIDRNAESEDDIKALLMHEFLHILLMHTAKYQVNTYLLNVALDAIINSIIHRTYGEKYSGFFSRYYKPEDMMTLLRTWDDTVKPQPTQWKEIHNMIYSGEIAGDDLHELLVYLKTGSKDPMGIMLMGNHYHFRNKLSEENKKIIKEILEKMDGVAIWNKSGMRGESDRLMQDEKKLKRMEISAWKQDTYRILQKCLVTDKTRQMEKPDLIQMPILSTGDRKAFARIGHTSFLPFSAVQSSRRTDGESTNIYLDVSGSMNMEIEHIISLLAHFRDKIRRPLRVFSNVVDNARFQEGQLVFNNTRGTSISCVLEHIRQNKYRRCLIVTDGETETITKNMMEGIDPRDLRVLISAQGNPSVFRNMNIPYHQLKPLKK
jgi:hypothetical protein